MPRKVSPECFIQLCQKGKHIAQKERKFIGAQVKGTGNPCINEYCIVLKVQVKRTGRHIIRGQVKRDKGKLQIQVKDSVTNLLYVY